MSMNMTLKALLFVTTVAGFVYPALADGDVGTLSPEKADRVFAAKPNYSPYAGRNFPTRPLFGDTHLHTGMSFDAGAFGARLTPRDAYRFARGEEIVASGGQPAKLSRPLDFLVVAESDQLRHKRSREIYRRVRQHHCALDILVFKPAEVAHAMRTDVSFISQAMNEGKTLYVRGN